MENQISQASDSTNPYTQQPNVVVSSQTGTNDQQSNPSQKSNPMKFVVIALVIIILALLGIIVYFFGFKNSQSKLSKAKSGESSQNGVNIVQTTVQTLPSPTSDPTTNWKTYEDTNNHFIFKYPPLWLKSSSAEPDSTGYYTELNDGHPFGQAIRVYDLPNPNRLTIH